eukprot:g73652.t1
MQGPAEWCASKKRSSFEKPRPPGMSDDNQHNQHQLKLLERVFGALMVISSPLWQRNVPVTLQAIRG